MKSNVNIIHCTYAEDGESIEEIIRKDFQSYIERKARNAAENLTRTS